MSGNPRSIYGAFVISTLIIRVVPTMWAVARFWPWLIMPALAVVGVEDLRAHRNVLRNYSIIDHLRYMLKFVSRHPII